MATTLNSGDLAITGFNFDNPDQFRFVLLRDIMSGTSINFTDNGVRSDGTFRTGEGILQWNASQNYGAGSVITISNPGNIAFSTAGDQIIAYQGTTSNPRFIFALNSQSTGFQSTASGTTSTALPPGLVQGQSAISLNEIDNARYVGPTSGTRSGLLSAITNRTNWIGSNTTRQSLSTSPFTVTSGGSSNGSSVHLTFGNPSGASTNPAVSNNYLLTRDQYALSYNDNRRTANWVGWQLNNSWLGSTPRQDDFRTDTALPSGFFRVGPTDYQGSGFDRGHITPSADRTASVTDNSNTFFMTNMIPQAPNNNRGVWASLENHIRTLLTGNDVYIYAGGYGTGGTGSNGFRTSIGPGITVPARTWKTLLVVDQGETPSQVSADDYIITVDIPNSQSVSGTSWQDYVVSVNDLEQDTGYDFFAALPNTVESFLESQVHGGGSTGGSDPSVFINEIHYDNAGSDRNEGIEIAGLAGTSLSGWSLEFYNGNGNGLYGSVNLSGTIPNQDSGHGGLFFPIGGIQNGAPDGVALVDNQDEVVQFLSYEGTITAVNGSAVGLTSENIGVSESGATPLGYSLQLAGTGNSYDDFSWTNASANTYGLVNTGQNFI